MFQIVYVSEAAALFAADDLRDLLVAARAKNQTNGISGMLVFCRGQFLQVLEGEASSVTTTFARIQEDPRHSELKALHRGHSRVGPSFKDWSMGFHSIDRSGLPAGFVKVNDRIDLSQFDGASALDFLRACRGLLSPDAGRSALPDHVADGGTVT